MHLMLVVVLALVGAAVSQAPIPCKSPAQWSATRVRYDFKEKIVRKERYHHDAIYQRTKKIEEIEQGESKEFYEIYRFYPQRKQYIINLKTKYCNTTALTRPFPVYEISPNDRFLGEYVIGTTAVPGEGVTIQQWGGMGREPGTMFSGAWTLSDCLLTRWGYFSNTTGPIEESSYYDITLGVNPEDFIQPSSCMG
ncbi:mammalian ependymin-related protein 1 [Lingula anatina]|uniref:Mammalian ependymin-related protein 1 n=1 Tax=Lingula anatina TaxID=7574 RepID=A0A1S3K784_LINAN|nr:mammalian ependymin-related protein 1 [Lingula anatina]|eukprot:XP_013418304.1 mammalian ependymin-related protein 1 [Lingula anatina]